MNRDSSDSLGRVERKLEEKTEALHRLEEKVDMILGKFKQEEIQAQKGEAATSTALYRFGAPIPPPAGPARQLGDLVSALKGDGVTAEELNKNFDFISALVLYQGNNSTALVPAARPQAQEPYTHGRYAEGVYRPNYNVQRPAEKRYPDHSTRYRTPSPKLDLGHSYITNSRPHGRQATAEEASDDEIEQDRFDMRENATYQYVDDHGYSRPQTAGNSYGAANVTREPHTRAFDRNSSEIPVRDHDYYPRARVLPSSADDPRLMDAWDKFPDTARPRGISPQSRNGSYGQANVDHPSSREQQAEFIEQQRAEQARMAQEQQQAAYAQHMQAQEEMARLRQQKVEATRDAAEMEDQRRPRKEGARPRGYPRGETLPAPPNLPPAPSSSSSGGTETGTRQGYDEKWVAENARLEAVRKATGGGGSVVDELFSPGGSLYGMDMGSARASRSGSYGQADMEHPRFREQQAEFIEQQRVKRARMAQEQQQAAYAQHMQAMARLQQQQLDGGRPRRGDGRAPSSRERGRTRAGKIRQESGATRTRGQP